MLKVKVTKFYLDWLQRKSIASSGQNTQVAANPIEISLHIVHFVMSLGFMRNLTETTSLLHKSVLSNTLKTVISSKFLW